MEQKEAKKEWKPTFGGSKLVCSNCGQRVEREAQACPICHLPFTAKIEANRVWRSTFGGAKLTCSNCGKETEKAAEKCANCGAIFVEKSVRKNFWDEPVWAWGLSIAHYLLIFFLGLVYAIAGQGCIFLILLVPIVLIPLGWLLIRLGKENIAKYLLRISAVITIPSGLLQLPLAGLAERQGKEKQDLLASASSSAPTARPGLR